MECDREIALFLSVRVGVVKCLKIVYRVHFTSNTLFVPDSQSLIAVVVILELERLLYWGDGRKLSEYNIILLAMPVYVFINLTVDLIKSVDR